VRLSDRLASVTEAKAPFDNKDCSRLEGELPERDGKRRRIEGEIGERIQEK